jgi:exopolysaccharide biosynthesis protein
MLKRNVKIVLLGVLIILSFESLHSQNHINSIINTLHWEKKELVKGLIWEHTHTRDSVLFNSRQNINILRISKNVKNLELSIGRTNPEGGTLTSDLAKLNDALAGINASFFNVRTGQSVNMIKQNGQIKDTTQTKNQKYSAHQLGIFGFKGSNAAILMRDTSLGKTWDENLTWENAIESGPLLLMQGKRMALAENAFNLNRHPRTCLCLTKNEILLLTADGRTNEAYGLSLFELSELLESLGCVDALNFDGGGSSAMYIKGASASGIVNMPCDNKLFDHEGERKVSNALLIKATNE